MKLILTADIHADPRKLNDLRTRAPEVDGVIVAGDLVDKFSRDDLPEQKARVLAWRQGLLQRGIAVAWSSGNHDFDQGDRTPTTRCSPVWMINHAATEMGVEDAQSKLLKLARMPLVVTTLPWPDQGDEILVAGYRTTYRQFCKRLLDTGRRLATESNAPWIVVSHDGPLAAPAANDHHTLAADITRDLVQSFQPSFSLHGHIHDLFGGSWYSLEGETVSFNAGQSPLGESPNYILLALHSGSEWTAEWMVGAAIKEAICFRDGVLSRG